MSVPMHLAQDPWEGRNNRPARGLIFAMLMLLTANYVSSARAQTEATTNYSATRTTAEKVDQLASAIAQVQSQMEANQKLLIDLQQQLQTLRLQMAAEAIATPPTTSTASSEAAPSLEELREHQAIDESQLATHELIKVETESKYPLKLSGLVLFNGFVNTRRVDNSTAPAYALSGSGATGFSVRQTVLALDARGPHLLGASSHADVRADFFATSTQTGYSSGVLRLRTAHAGLQWANSEAFFALDRSILEPNAPSSLLAIGQPELAWAGNLWNWNPQIGASHQFSLGDSARIQTQVALIDAGDPRPPKIAATTANVTGYNRWPGTEARVAYLYGTKTIGPEIGVGGYFSPHRSTDNISFDAWAATLDLRLPLTKYFEFTANVYRGQALGGLGGGGYVDYVYRFANHKEITRGLEDVGGWTQLQARLGQGVELNTGYGIDNPFVSEIRSSFYGPDTSSYAGLARNRSSYSNIIYKPSAYLLFSLEYRRLWSNYPMGPTYVSDVIGIGVGYKF